VSAIKATTFAVLESTQSLKSVYNKPIVLQLATADETSAFAAPFLIAYFFAAS